nr:hypothetical protein [uncultured Sellimonas sp.]
MQLCERALTSLKYFCEDAPDYHIIVAGSLLGVAVSRAKSLKVYMDTYKPAYDIKLSAKNFGFEDGKKTVPLYVAFCI